MPEEKKNEAEPVKSGGGMGRLFLLAGVILVAAIGGLATYLFVLAPMLKDPEAGKEAHAKADTGDLIPHGAVPVDFEKVVVNVVREGTGPASILQFGVTLECSNEETKKLVEAHKARFIDIINKLHDSRTRSELDDTLLIKESIERQALQKTNELLKKLQEKPTDEIKITAVLHHAFVVQDPS
jgi:flagellar basal body-associated protein FliL